MEQTALRSHAIDPSGVSLFTDEETYRAKVLVAADGLHSPLRKAEGLELASDGPRRFGLRRHLERAWAPRVEVHFAPGLEAYVTPAGHERVGVAFLWTQGAVEEKVTFEALLAHFPALRDRLAGAPFASEPLGAGPLSQRVSKRVKDRFVLLGDAAGYVDAITGEGLSLAFTSAHVLAELLPEALKRNAAASTFAGYERALDRLFRRYAWLAGTLVWAAGRPGLRRFAVNRLADFPALFTWALGYAMGQSEPVTSSPQLVR
jgi:flavin-dependent dehydrogenase